MRLIFAPLFWTGRVLLWIVFFPLGIWRSLRHGAKKDQRKLIAEMQRLQAKAESQAPSAASTRS